MREVLKVLCAHVLTQFIRSAKSALHGLVHWLANTYVTKGITINGIAPALIEHTKMLPGSSEELSKSTSSSTIPMAASTPSLPSRPNTSPQYANMQQKYPLAV